MLGMQIPMNSPFMPKADNATKFDAHKEFELLTAKTEEVWAILCSLEFNQRQAVIEFLATWNKHFEVTLSNSNLHGILSGAIKLDSHYGVVESPVQGALSPEEIAELQKGIK